MSVNLIVECDRCGGSPVDDCGHTTVDALRACLANDSWEWTDEGDVCPDCLRETPDETPSPAS